MDFKYLINAAVMALSVMWTAFGLYVTESPWISALTPMGKWRPMSPLCPATAVCPVLTSHHSASQTASLSRSPGLRLVWFLHLPQSLLPSRGELWGTVAPWLTNWVCSTILEMVMGMVITLCRICKQKQHFTKCFYLETYLFENRSIHELREILYQLYLNKTVKICVY